MNPGQAGRTGRTRAVTVGFVALIVLVGAFNFAATRFPELKFLSAIDAFEENPEMLLRPARSKPAKT